MGGGRAKEKLLRKREERKIDNGKEREGDKERIIERKKKRGERKRKDKKIAAFKNIEYGGTFEDDAVKVGLDGAYRS